MINKNTPGTMKTEAEIRYRLKELKTDYDKETENLPKIDTNFMRREVLNDLTEMTHFIDALEWVLGL